VRNFVLSPYRICHLEGLPRLQPSHISSRIFSTSSLPFKIRCGPLEGTVLGAELCLHDTRRSVSETLDIMNERAVGGGHIGGPERLVSLIYCSLEVRSRAIPSSVLEGHSMVIEVSLGYAFGRPREHVRLHPKVFIIEEISLDPWLTIGRCELSIREPPPGPHLRRNVIKPPHIQALDGSSTGRPTYALPPLSAMYNLRGSIAHDPPVR